MTERATSPETMALNASFTVNNLAGTDLVAVAPVEQTLGGHQPGRSPRFGPNHVNVGPTGQWRRVAG